MVAIITGRHSPFQVLDASAIEGIRGLAGESSSIYSCIQIYKALTPPTPPAYQLSPGGAPDIPEVCTVPGHRAHSGRTVARVPSSQACHQRPPGQT